MSFLKRFLIFFTLHKYQFVYIHREVASIGPPIFEWLISKVFRKKIIYDFDDSIWVNSSSKANPMAGFVKCTWKVSYICKWSHVVSVGNDFLAQFARQYCSDVRVIPTIVDLDTKHNQIKKIEAGRLTIGWTGTFTNFVQLDLVIDTIKKLQAIYHFDFLIIADKDPEYKEITYQFLKWRLDSEIEDLIKIDIGVMPLGNGILELGKCAFKAIQYMSLGIPAVVSPVGANCVVVQNNINGLWADSPAEWYSALEALLNDYDLRQRIAKAGRIRIEEHYSVAATSHLFWNLFYTPHL